MAVKIFQQRVLINQVAVDLRWHTPCLRCHVCSGLNIHGRFHSQLSKPGNSQGLSLIPSCSQAYSGKASDEGIQGACGLVLWRRGRRKHADDDEEEEEEKDDED